MTYAPKDTAGITKINTVNIDWVISTFVEINNNKKRRKYIHKIQFCEIDKKLKTIPKNSYTLNEWIGDYLVNCYCDDILNAKIIHRKIYKNKKKQSLAKQKS